MKLLCEKDLKKKSKEDFNSFNSRIPYISHYEIKKQIQNIYTTSTLKEFQQELTSKIYCELSSCKENGGTLEFLIVEDVFFGEDSKRVPFKVCLNKEHFEINCTCQLFQFRGIVCRHSILVFIHEKISQIPEKYILRRWRKDIKRPHTKVKIGYVDWNL